jgi:hypothetical protein
MFTGRASASVLAEEHPLILPLPTGPDERPISRRAIPDQPAPPPPLWMTITAAALGLLALGVGLALVGMIMWVRLC